MNSSTLENDKTIRLFTYLKELSLLKAPLIRDIQNYEHVIFLKEIPNGPECLSPLTSQVTDPWVEIKKPTKPVFPRPPEILLNWLSTSFELENTKTEPNLLEKIANPNDVENEGESLTDPVLTNPPFLHINDFPQIKQTFQEYKETKWQPWKNKYLSFESLQNIYTKLFSVYQKQKKLGEQYELIAGIGLLNWKTPDSQIVHRHVLTIPCSFQFDANHGIIRVLPSSEESNPELEQDMLELENRLDSKALSPILEKVEELQNNFWNKEILDSIFRSFAFSLSANSTYKENELNHKREAKTEPEILYSPAIILRKRTEKGFQQACTAIIENTKEPNAYIPQGIKRIFEEIDDYHESGTRMDGSSTNHSEVDTTIYFPLEANDEQRKIIENLKTRNGVLVQGPPGTGKSHTIANLISHLLSTGKRVLITSETARALHVLKDKIPDEMQNLCVSLLGADSKSFKDLEKVVQIISNRKDTWNQNQTASKIDQQTTELKKLKEQKALLQTQLRSVREKETFEHNLLNGVYSGTAQSIAKRIHDEQAQYDWLKDTPSMDEITPLSKQGGYELIELLQLLNDEVQEQIQYSIPPLELLMNDEKFKQSASREAIILEKLTKYESLNQDKVTDLAAIKVEERETLSQLLTKWTTTFNEINRIHEDWLPTALQDLLNLKFRPWEEFYQQINQSIEEIKELVVKHNLTDITGTGDVPLSQMLADVRGLHEHFKEGKGLGFSIWRPKEVKDAMYIVNNVRVDGRKCDSLEPISLLKEVLQTDYTLGKIKAMIQDQLKIENSTIQSRALFLAKTKDIMEPFKLLLEMKELIQRISSDFQKYPILFEKPLNEQYVPILQEGLDFITLKEEQKGLEDMFQHLLNHIQQNVDKNEKHPLVNELIKSIVTRNTENYSLCIEKLTKLDEYSQKSRRCEQLLQPIKVTLPKLYAELVQSNEFHTWTARLNSLENAMNWAKVKSWLIQFSQTNEAELTKRLDDTDRRIKQTVAILGANKAWYSTLSSMTEGQRQHLLAWSTSMRKVGKGTGKNAHVHLKDAQKHMSQCRDAIPAWIMPLYRVFDNFDVKPNLFDVVIMDEASQSGPDAIILQYIARKLIVVGDDKQISPEYIGIKREDVQYLRNQYLSDFKLADMLDIENSFFDLANVLFGGRITLREHFRCMPEIIEFCNRISYSNTPLVPLRQYPPNRLEPIKAVHVPTGHREGSGSKIVNRPEAEAVTAQIKACVEHPLYKNKSIGVISLQGEGQAQLIEGLLVDAIGTEEIEKRDLMCGDAYTFQGDERDIMFLSLVAAPGQTAMRALTTEKDKRRFNVAVSRAKDQLWLFHTPTVNDIRNHDDLRYQLITYCKNPVKEILESNRALCESDFERSVFDQITARGYKVIPQHEVAGYRIDLVVEGAKGRIAVECDGDYWHGPDRYDHDMNRQRILERCGWRFWRVRGSEYYYDPDRALTSLWETLKYYEIEPAAFSAKSHEEISEKHTDSFQQDEIEILVSENDPYLVDVIQSEHLLKNEAAAGMAVDESVQNEESLEVPPESYVAEIQTHLSPKDGLKEYLESKGLEVVDKRSTGGALWLIGGQELSSLISELKEDHITFTFAYSGSKSTDRRPAWYSTYQD